MFALGHPGPRKITDENAFVEFEAPRPTPDDEDVLVKVAYSGINPIDAKLRGIGNSNSSNPRILGFEGSGWVEDVGSHAGDLRPGDRVAWLGQVDRAGSNAEFTLVNKHLVKTVPENVSLEDAAAVPLSFLTAFGLLFGQMGISEGQEGTLLIINGAGSVGSAAIQLALLHTKMTVIATASRPETVDWCRAMGAHKVISHRENLVEGLRAAGHKSVDAVASLSNTQANFSDILKCLAPHGTVGVIDEPDTLETKRLRVKAHRLAYEGVFVTALMQPDSLPRQGADLERILRWMSEGKLRSIRNTGSYHASCESLFQIHRILEAQKSIGKIVMRIGAA